MSEFYVQSPTEVLEYQISWSNMLSSGETITTSDWTAPVALTVSNKSVNGSTTICKVAGGAIGNRYQLTNTIITSNGETLVTSIFILVEVK